MLIRFRKYGMEKYMFFSCGFATFTYLNISSTQEGHSNNLEKQMLRFDFEKLWDVMKCPPVNIAFLQLNLDF